MATTMQQAVDTYLARKDRTAHPAGSFDKAGRWFPTEAETCGCCNAVREPSRAYPYSLMTHCRSIGHVACLFGVDETELRRAVRTARPPKAAASRAGVYYKAVAVTDDGRYVSVYDGETEYRIGTAMTQAVRKGHNGGYYVYATEADARRASVPTDSVAADLPRVVLQVEARGQFTAYPCTCYSCQERGAFGYIPAHADKLAFSTVTPVAVVDAVAEAA